MVESEKMGIQEQWKVKGIKDAEDKLFEEPDSKRLKIESTCVEST